MTADSGNARNATRSTGRGSRLRVLVVGRRFWPLVGFDSAQYVTALTMGLSRAEFHVEVLTAKFASSWTDPFQFHDTVVHRPMLAPRGDWTVSRYTRQLTQWIRGRADSFDVILVDSIREEAIAAIEACRGRRCKVILRLSGDQGVSDSDWWNRNRASKRCAAIGRLADAVLVRSPAQQRALLAHQYDPQKIHRVAASFMARTESSPAARLAARKRARKALAAVNSDLVTTESTPVVVCHARMHPASGIDRLVQAARPLITRNPDTRIWFLGDGSARDQIHTQLRGDGVRSSIAMPGSFSSVDEFMAAADVFVQAGDDGLDYFLPAAISAAIPVVAADSDAIRSTLALSDELAGCVAWFDTERPSSIRKVIQATLSELPAANAKAISLRTELIKRRPQSAMIGQYSDLIRGLCGVPLADDVRDASRQPGSSIGQRSTGTDG